jgi:hypothetical protein
MDIHLYITQTVSGYFEYDDERSSGTKQMSPQLLEDFIHADVLKPHVEDLYTDRVCLVS